jgi:hypothetical protein
VSDRGTRVAIGVFLLLILVLLLLAAYGYSTGAWDVTV